MNNAKRLAFLCMYSINSVLGQSCCAWGADILGSAPILDLISEIPQKPPTIDCLAPYSLITCSNQSLCIYTMCSGTKFGLSVAGFVSVCDTSTIGALASFLHGYGISLTCETYKGIFMGQNLSSNLPNISTKSMTTLNRIDTTVTRASHSPDVKSNFSSNFSRLQAYTTIPTHDYARENSSNFTATAPGVFYPAKFIKRRSWLGPRNYCENPEPSPRSRLGFVGVNTKIYVFGGTTYNGNWKSLTIVAFRIISLLQLLVHFSSKQCAVNLCGTRQS